MKIKKAFCIKKRIKKKVYITLRKDSDMKTSNTKNMIHKFNKFTLIKV